MQKSLLTLAIFLLIGLIACKKDLINDEGKVRIYAQGNDNAPVTGVIAIEGSPSVTFLENNKVKINTGAGNGPVTVKYKIFGDFETRGSVIKFTIADREVRYVVVSGNQIATDGSILIRVN
jgi:hypothetical protein